MRIAFVEPEVPNREFSTVSYGAWLIIERLIAEGHQVTAVLPLTSESTISDGETRQRWIRDLAALGASTIVVPADLPQTPFHGRVRWRAGQARRLLRPTIADYFPHTQMASRMKAALDEANPEAIIIWGGSEGVAATHGISTAPRFAFMGDPDHMSAMFRQYPPFVRAHVPGSPSFAAYRLESARKAQMLITLVGECEAAAATAAHHATWYRANGVDHCQYLPNMVPDWGGPDWRNARDEAHGRTRPPGSTRFKIVLMGHVGGTATLSGLYFFANKVLPRLEVALGEHFEVHICGKGDLPADLASKLSRPAVRLRGFVDDIIEELRSADVFVVPTPIELGIRVRIPYAWSLGSCVVAHKANAAGLPELEQGRNCLLGGDGAEVAHAIESCYRDQVLQRRLVEGGRDTYERSFSHDVTYPKIFAQLERIARESGSRAGTTLARAA